MPNDYGASHDRAKSREKQNRVPLWGKNSSIPNTSGINPSRSNTSEKDEKEEYGKPISFRANEIDRMRLEAIRTYLTGVYKSIDENYLIDLDSNTGILKKIIELQYNSIQGAKLREEQKKG